jgi:HK97 gp10 family phage protein
MRSGPVRRNVVAALTQLPVVKRQVRVVAAVIRTDARQRAKKRTGAMARSIKVDNVLQDGQVVHRVGWDRKIAFYGPLVELGTKKTRAQPHLQPAAEAANRRRGR